MTKFRKGENLLAPQFREKLNRVARAAEKTEKPGAYTHAQQVQGQFVQTPLTVFALMRVKAGETWGLGTTDGVTDDVNSATCEFLMWLNTDDASNPNKYVGVGDEVEVYNSISTTEPAGGTSLLAIFNRQSGRWELLT